VRATARVHRTLRRAPGSSVGRPRSTEGAPVSPRTGSSSLTLMASFDRHRPRILLGLVVSVAVTLGARAVLARHATRAPAAARAAARASDSGESFTVLRTARQSSDRLSSSVRATLAQSTRPAFDSIDLTDARHVPSATPAWLVPAANGELCLVRLVYALVGGPGGKPLPPSTVLLCASLEVAQSGGLVATQSTSATARGSQFHVVGVAPSGVSSATITASDGRRSTVPVVRNVYAATSSDPVAVTLVTHSSGGSVSRTVQLETPTLGRSRQGAGRSGGA